jgi:HSP20 family protein
MPFWERKKKIGDSPFDSLFNVDFNSSIFEGMERQMEEIMRAFNNPEFVRRQENRGKPIVSGFSIKIRPDGKVDVEQFGNVKPVGEKAIVKDEREPLVDVINRPKEVTVIAELPGVDKKEIKLKVAGESNILDISVPHKFSKKVKLPAKVKPSLAKANYKNGILEVTLTKQKEDKGDASEIPVE